MFTSFHVRGREKSQSPYGAKRFATPLACHLRVKEVVSQSPYGAKRFATEEADAVYELLWGRNPLTGLSGLQPGIYDYAEITSYDGRNPLTGLSGLQPFWRASRALHDPASQSPYGAKRFATPLARPLGGS